MKFLIALALVATVVCFTEQEYQDAFTNWMHEQDMKFDNAEFQYRYSAFKTNYDFVMNWDAEKEGFEVELNKFAAYPSEEFNSIYNKLNYNAAHNELVLDDGIDYSKIEIPASVNWAQKGAVTGIKNQGQCGSCWSFSTTGGMEGIHEISTGNLVSFSEQNLMDCSWSYGNMGCDGGLMDYAFKYIIANKGLDTESSYPYTAESSHDCKYTAANSGGTISAYTNVPSGNEQALTADIVNQPISVAIDAGLPSFQMYKSGVYYSAECSSTALDHGVLAVGYGVDASQNNAKYYIVKNSWGATWGQQGYIWMSRDRGNNCGIATAASYPSA